MDILLNIELGDIGDISGDVQNELRKRIEQAVHEFSFKGFNKLVVDALTRTLSSNMNSIVESVMENEEYMYEAVNEALEEFSHKQLKRVVYDSLTRTDSRKLDKVIEDLVLGYISNTLDAVIENLYEDENDPGYQAILSAFKKAFKKSRAMKRG